MQSKNDPQSRTTVVTVQGKAYTIVKFDAVTGMRYVARIGKVIGPLLGSNAGALDDLDLNDSEQSTKLKNGMVVVSALEHLSVDSAIELIVDLCESAHYSGGELAGENIIFNHAFDDDLLAAVMLALEVAKYNFEKYLKGLSQGTAQANSTDDSNKPSV